MGGAGVDPSPVPRSGVGGADHNVDLADGRGGQRPAGVPTLTVRDVTVVPDGDGISRLRVKLLGKELMELSIIDSLIGG